VLTGSLDFAILFSLHMPRRVRKSPEFGRWVKQARLDCGKNQQQLADSASVSQQYWSKIELQGLVPTPEQLASICKALGKSEEEAQEILGTITEIDERARMLEKEFAGFQQWLIRRPQPVHIFIVREDAEPVDDNSVTLHYEILSAAPHLRLSILFRYSERKVWASFRRLAEAIGEMWSVEEESSNGVGDTPKQNRKRSLSSEEEPSNGIGDRLSGYYRKLEEDRERSIPLGQPAVVVMDPTGPYLFYYGSPPPLYDQKQQPGDEDFLAPYKNTVLSTAPKDKAQLFVNWIEPEGLSGRPSEELWTQILPYRSPEVQ
jgi:transcriptional regulator with XRE-family HTH domain